ncbi:hypothetical protein [Sporichthya sp.]|uniref:hypothetical protein n=1 Tax=Sporichthya sp. TaxID=65475 RepID=UPI0017C20917|nr:hypothetical protein [Sporichthya sp.]MBA3744793.1 hypothetical protein [Sporichthya sp.]
MTATAAEQAKCSCLVNDENDQLADADVVFKGVYEGSTSSAYRDRDGQTHESGIVRHFTAFESYKGEVRPDTAVVDLSDGCGEGVGGMGGETTYLVFAEHPTKAAQKQYDLAESDLVLQPCGGTREIDADDEPSFGPGKRVTAAEEPETTLPAEPAGPAEPEGEKEHSLSVLGDLLGDLLDRLLGNVQTPDGDGFQLLELGNLGEAPGTPPGGEGGAPEVTVPELGGLPAAPPPPAG